MNLEEKQPKILTVGMYISGAAILLMMVLTVIDVTLKNLFETSIPGSYLYVQNYLMPLAFFCGMPYAFFSGIFPRLDMFINKWKESTRIKLIITILIVELIAYITIACYSFLYGLYGWRTNITFLAGVNSYPFYPMFFLVTLAFGLLSFYLFQAIKRTIQTKGKYNFFPSP